VNISRTRFLCRSWLLIAATLPLLTISHAADGERFEMWEEPSHQLVFVDGPARVLDVRIAPGVTSEFHKHRFATVYVIIQDALVANQFWEDEWSASGPRELRGTGSTVDNANYVEKPSYHRVRNEDDKTFHVVAVINERSLASESRAADSAAVSAIVDNVWFKEHRIRVAADVNSDILKYVNDVVLVQFDAGPSDIIEGGVSHSFKSAPGAFSWHPAGSEFRIGNRSTEAMEFVLMEIKD
jgi:hypothetical protein